MAEFSPELQDKLDELERELEVSPLGWPCGLGSPPSNASNGISRPVGARARCNRLSRPLAHVVATTIGC